jgi:hypothetical protein
MKKTAGGTVFSKVLSPSSIAPSLSESRMKLSALFLIPLAASAAEGDAFFRERVEPLLKQRCFEFVKGRAHRLLAVSEWQTRRRTSAARRVRGDRARVAQQLLEHPMTLILLALKHARHVIEILEKGYLAARTGCTQELRTTF